MTKKKKKLEQSNRDEEWGWGVLTEGEEMWSRAQDKAGGLCCVPGASGCLGLGWTMGAGDGLRGGLGDAHITQGLGGPCKAITPKEMESQVRAGDDLI